jgi:hypothetical protein
LTIPISKKVISKTLNKAKYATAADDEFMKSLQQMSSMGSPITMNYVINLPRRAKRLKVKPLNYLAIKRKLQFQ